MRQLKLLLAGGALFLAIGSGAQADDLTRNFTGVASGSVQWSSSPGAGSPRNLSAFFEPDSAGQIDVFVGSLGANQNKGGGNVEAFVTLTSTLASFESGTAAVGPNSLSQSVSGIDILFTNVGDGTIGLENFVSTIIPAGMGFYVQDRSGPATDGNPFLGYGQSTQVEFSDFFVGNGGGVAANEVFAEVAFDFQVETNEYSLYSLSGLVSLSFDEAGELLVNETLTGPGGAGQYLDGFRTAVNNHHALGYDWQATNIVIPLSEVGSLSGYSERVVSYRANVTSRTVAPCINNRVNCIVAYSGFGDPIGRGGGDDEAEAFAFSDFSSFSDFGPFDSDAGNDHDFVIQRLKFDPVDNIQISGAVPEPSTWAVMITGFGFAGAALRRRRRVAYS